MDDVGVSIDSDTFSNSPGSSVSISGGLLALLSMLRASPLPNWMANWIVFFLGVAIQCLVSGWTVTSLLQGIMVGSGAIGIHRVGFDTKWKGKDGVQGTGDTQFIKKEDKP